MQKLLKRYASVILNFVDNVIKQVNKGKTFVKVWKKIDVCFEGATLWVQDGLEQEFRNQS